MEIEKKTQLPRPGRSNLCARVARPVPYTVGFPAAEPVEEVLPGARIRGQIVKLHGASIAPFEPETTTATRLLRVRFYDGRPSVSAELGFVQGLQDVGVC